MNPSEVPQLVAGLRRRRVAVVAIALALLVLIVGAPVWAATVPSGLEQGTVPPPPSGNDNNSDHGSNNDDDNDTPDATPTPAIQGPASEAPAAVAPAAVEPAAVAPAGVGSTVTGIVAAPRLNVRSGPGVTYSVLGSVYQDQRVEIQFRDAAGGWWYSCCISGTTTSGWVSALFIQPEFDAAQASTLIPVATNLTTTLPVAATPVPARTTTSGALTGTVDATRLNLRGGPGIDAPILGKLLNGEKLDILSRNTAGDWWYVCCLAGTQTEGWVSAQFVTPDFARGSANQLLPVYGEEVHAILPTPTPKPPKTTFAPTIASASALTAAAGASIPATTTLGMQLAQEPAWVAPGQALDLLFVISNTGSVTATAVELRNELAPQLALSGGKALTAGAFTSKGSAGGPSIFTVSWPEVAPGDAVTATVSLTLSTDALAGSVIDNIAAVAAANARSTTAGVGIGMPPTALPDFQ